MLNVYRSFKEECLLYSLDVFLSNHLFDEIPYISMTGRVFITNQEYTSYDEIFCEIYKAFEENILR